MLEPQQDARDWQRDVMTELRKLADVQSQTAVVLERINGRIDGIDTRLKAQEQATTATPASRAAWSQAYAAWVALAVSLLAVFIALAAPHIAIH